MGLDEDAVRDDFPAALPESDREAWGVMTPSQRARARDRLAAIVSWQKGEMKLDEAMKVSDLSRTRFYTVAAEFRAAGTLASLGAFAGAGASRQRLNPEAVNALQAVVAEVVATNEGASISELVRLLVEAANVDPAKLPGATRLRGFVEAELRRKRATGQAGHALKLGLSAINLPRADGRPHILFTLLDEGTRLILGAWSGGTTNEAEGYAYAARDAIARIGNRLSQLQWADRLMRIDVEVGADRERATALRVLLANAEVGANVSLAPTRYGRYFRQLVGTRIGRVEITPARTESGDASPDNNDMTPWTDEEARAAVVLAVEQHNASVLSAMNAPTGRPVMPEGLEKALGILAALP